MYLYAVLSCIIMYSRGPNREKECMQHHNGNLYSAIHTSESYMVMHPIVRKRQGGLKCLEINFAYFLFSSHPLRIWTVFRGFILLMSQSKRKNASGQGFHILSKEKILRVCDIICWCRKKFCSLFPYNESFIHKWCHKRNTFSTLFALVNRHQNKSKY